MDSIPNASASACPEWDTLAAFCRGRLPDDSVEGIAEHVSACCRCATILERLQSEDTLLSHLRRRADNPVVDDALCQRLAERARGLAEAESLPATISAANLPETETGPSLPMVFGPYLLLERLGQGGMGVVYKARQETLKRLVAVKMIRAGMYANNEERQRFRREGEAIARIRHAHVVQIHEFSEHEGQPYFSMELLEGGTLSGRLRAGALPQREAAALVRTLAQAVAAAHEQGIVHRDLKPANVLFSADGTAKITDFGLAKILDGENSETLSDAILGTPVYMAPEQARGESRQIGPATDVYALGAILYECLTGQPPFRGGSRSQTLELVREGEPELPSRRCLGLSRDLEAICLKCLEKESRQRYDSAATLAEDLDRWLRGEPTSVRAASWPMRFWRRLRRHPRLASAAGLLLLAMVVLLASLWYRDPERPIRTIESELARGRAQTLIGETGPPAWFNWCIGKETSVASHSRSEPFSIHTSHRALLELVRNPGRDRFKFQAEVRHEESMELLGEVGLYVAQQRYDSRQGQVRYFIPLAFNDIYDEAQRPLGWPVGEPWIRVMNQVTLQPRLFWEDSRWSDSEFRLSGPGPELFPAARARGKVQSWHLLTFQVSREGVQGFWGDTVVGRLDTLELGPGLRRNLDMRRQTHPEELRFQGFEPDLFPRGSLGLYVRRGSASFRRVVIEPLGLSD